MTLRHEFVDHVPAQLADGVLYVSISFATAVHSCACGCGQEVVTPLSPTDWKLTFDGESVSLYPSIGNWSFACRSHYWIRNDRVKWAGRWSDDEIKAGRARDRSTKARFYKEPNIPTELAMPAADKRDAEDGGTTTGTPGGQQLVPRPPSGLRMRIRRWWDGS